MYLRCFSDNLAMFRLCFSHALATFMLCLDDVLANIRIIWLWHGLGLTVEGQDLGSGNTTLILLSIFIRLL